MRVDVILGAGLPAGEVEALGRLADARGIHTLWVSSFPSRRDPWLALAGLAQRTNRVRLGTLPISPYEVHPLRIADALLTLNEMSQGRACVLVGGLGRSVSRVTGLKPSARLAAVRDCLSILKGLRPDAPLSYSGERYSLLDYRAEWATSSPPLVYAGATGPQMLRMSAAIADGVMMSDVPLARMPEVVGHLRAGFAEAGRVGDDFRVSNFAAWHIGTDRAAGLREARQELVWRGLLQRWHTECFLEPAEAELVESRWPAFLQAFLRRTPEIEGVPEPVIERLVEQLSFAGGLEDLPRVIRDLEDYAAAGLDEVALKVHGNAAEAIRIIGEHIVPALS